MFFLPNRIGALIKADLLEKWLTVHSGGNESKYDKRLTHLGHKSTGLDHTSGALFIFATGIVTSFIVFLVDVTVYNIRNKIQNWSTSVIGLFEHRWHAI